jgi:hypothetical protein
VSVITDMLLLTNEEPDSEPIVALNAWCAKHANGQIFTHIAIDDHDAEAKKRASGGGKVFCTNVYACAGNYFPWEKLVIALPSFGWDSYAAETTALILQDENVERWIAVHADGRRVERTRKETWGPPEPEKRAGGHIVRWHGAYWDVINMRWTDSSEATVFYGGLEWMLAALRPQHPGVEGVVPPEETEDEPEEDD